MPLDVYRSRLPEPDGRWYVVIARHKTGTVRHQADVTDLFERRYQDAVSTFQADLEARAGAERQRADDLQRRLDETTAALEEVALACQTAHAEKQSAVVAFEEHLCQQETHWGALMESRIAEALEKRQAEIDAEKLWLTDQMDLVLTYTGQPYKIVRPEIAEVTA